MAKSQIVNILVNKYQLERTWLNQFPVKDLSEMLEQFNKKFGKVA